MSNVINFCNKETEVGELLASRNRTYKRTSRAKGRRLYTTKRVKRAAQNSAGMTYMPYNF
jgi:hypothetical protein